MRSKSKQKNYNNRKKPKELSLCENNIISTNKINNKEYSTENLNKNKKLKYNNSLTTFNSKNNINNKVERKLMSALSSSQLVNIKNDIYAIYTMAEQKKFKSSINNTKKSKNEKKNNNCENKYEIYNKDNLAYQIYHDYQKLHFNDENLNFLERMELYGLKKSLKDIKINEYINIKSPKLPEKERKKIFDSLINDCTLRKKKKEKLNQNIFKINQKVNKKRMEEIVNRLYNAKKIKKIKIHNEKEISVKINPLDKEVINNKKNKKANVQNIKTINKCNSTKNMNKIYELNRRLYYNEINKKDIQYKMYLQKVNELLGINNIKIINNMMEIPDFSNSIGKINNVKDDFLSYSQLENLRKVQKNNERQKNYSKSNRFKEKYVFKDDNSLVDNGGGSNNINGNGNNNNDDKKQNNDLFYSSNQNNIKNLKISIIIDNFFCNKQ